MSPDIDTYLLMREKLLSLLDHCLIILCEKHLCANEGQLGHEESFAFKESEAFIGLTGLSRQDKGGSVQQVE